MELDFNVVNNRSMIEYSYLYRKRLHVLKKYTVKQVEDYDKINAISVYKGSDLLSRERHLLLKGKKWWLIDGVYYQVPRAFSLCWIRNLNKGVKIATVSAVCLIALGLVGANHVIKVMSRPCADIALAEFVGDRASITNLHFDDSHNLLCNIQPKNETFTIYAIAITKGESTLQESRDFEFGYKESNYLLSVDSNIMNTVSGQIVISLDFNEPLK